MNKVLLFSVKHKYCKAFSNWRSEELLDFERLILLYE